MATLETVQREIEVILTRQLASYLAMPIFVVDPVGNMIYYNEPAEELFGMRFDETGEITVEEWTRTFELTDDAGTVLSTDTVPVGIALAHRRPAHRNFWLRSKVTPHRRVELTAVPLIGQEDRFLGVMGIFWEARS